MNNVQKVDGEKSFRLKSGMHLHLVGIGGTGISAIARVLLGRGYIVSGSDQQMNELTAALKAEGITVFRGHDPENIQNADALLVSSAIPVSNPEVVAAKSRGLPVLKRADLLGQLMEDSVGIAVAGTHGKTTTTAMIAQILIETGLDPTVIVGGILPSHGINGRHGEGEYFVIEADEYDTMFLGLRPKVIVITSLEHDHPDMFPTFADYVAAFRDFVALLPPDGRLVVCVDDSGAAMLLEDSNEVKVETITYAVPPNGGQGHSDASLQALDARPNQLGGTDFVVERDGQAIGVARLRVPGLHNVRNALAAITVALGLGIEFDLIRQALAEFGGVGRRFQVVGEAGRVTVIDDYAHHPTEIVATLSAARQRYPGRRLWAVWQPHTFSRTRLLFDEFAACFSQADRVVALDVFRSREQDPSGINSRDVVDAMAHPNAVHVAGFTDAATYILDRIRPDDLVVTLSAGDGNKVGELILDELRKRTSEE